MSLELINENIRMNQIVKTQTVETVVENDIIVPDVKPDISNILLMDGDVFVVSAETAENKIKINSRVEYNILYEADDKKSGIKSINTTNDFYYTFDIPGITSDMSSDVKCNIEHIEHNILNGRKVNVKCVVKITGKVMNEMQYDILQDLEGLENVQTSKENIQITSYIGNSNVPLKVEEVVDVPTGKPSILEILRSDMKLTNKEYEITENKVLVKADMNISTLYIGDDENRSIQFMENGIPLTYFVDLQGLTKESKCDMSIDIQDKRIEIEEDSDGELRLLKVDVNLNANIKGYENLNLELIKDAYSTKENLRISRKEIQVDKIISEEKNQGIIKENVSLNEESPDIVEVYNVINKLSVLNYTVINNKIEIEGVVDNGIVYLSPEEEQPVYYHQKQIPFKQNVEFKDLNENMTCDFDVNIDHCNYSMLSSREVEIRLVIGVQAKVIDKYKFNVIEDVDAKEREDKYNASNPSIIIYFSQQGDNLWKIAKKYYTTVDDIKKINDLGDKQEVSAGQKIFIPK